MYQGNSANHSAPWKPHYKLDLQMFAGEEEDAILPEDFVATPATGEPVEPVTPTEPNEVTPPVSETTPAAGTTPTEPVTPAEVDLSPLLKAISEKAKFNHGPLVVESLDEAVTLLQKGAVMDKAVERAKQESRDAYIAEQGFVWNGKTITTEADYKQAMAEKELLDKYQGQVPPEVMQEMIAGRKDREERAREKAADAEKAKRDAEDFEFLTYFQEVNGRSFDPTKDKFPEEVKKAIQAGKPLKAAYMEHHVKELRTQLQIAKQNEENLRRAPIGSVTAHGGTETGGKDDFERGFDSVE